MKNSKSKTINTITYIIKRAALLLVLLMISLLAIGQAATVFADGEESKNDGDSGSVVVGGAYEVTGYEMYAVVGRDHTITVEEQISVNIPDALKQIEFSIPSGSFRMRGIDVENTSFNVKNTSSGSSVIIADGQALSTGTHTYKIKYKIMEFADRDSTRDIFYFNVLLPEWKQPIGELSAVIVFPEDFPWDDMQYYAGQFGVQDTENRLDFDADKKTRTVTIEGKMIPENFGITLKDELPDGYWEGALDGIWALFAMVLVMGFVVLVMLIMWIIGGRDPRIKRVPQSRPIEGISPVELGYIFNSKLDGRDLVRMIIYFATKGYLKISEYEPKRYRLYRLNDPDGEEKLLRNAYSILFEDIYKGRALDMEDIGDRLLRIENAIRDDVAAGFSAMEDQAYTPLSRAFRTAGILMIGIGAAATNALNYSYQYIGINYVESVLIGAALALLTAILCTAVDRRDSSSGEVGITMEIIVSAMIVCVTGILSVGIVRATGHIISGLLVAALCVAAVFLAVIMRARGRGNSILMMRIRQLRRFISHPTPKELLENYLADPEYYYDMLIYALTFGAEESWAISFLTLDVAEPKWYSEDVIGNAFSNLKETPTTVDYARDIRSFVRIIEGSYDEMQRRRNRR